MAGEIVIEVRHSQYLAIRRQGPVVSEFECSSWRLQRRFDDQFGAAPAGAALYLLVGHRVRRFTTSRVIRERQQSFGAIGRDHEHRLDQRRITMLNLHEDFLRCLTAERAFLEIQLPESRKIQCDR